MADFLRHLAGSGDPRYRTLTTPAPAPRRAAAVAGRLLGLRGFLSSWDDGPGQVGQDVYEERPRDEWSPAWPDPDSLAPEYGTPMPQPFWNGEPEYWESGRGRAFDRPYSPYQPIPLARDDWAHFPAGPPDPEPTQPDDFAGPDEWERYWAARNRWLQRNADFLQ